MMREMENKKDVKLVVDGAIVASSNEKEQVSLDGVATIVMIGRENQESQDEIEIEVAQHGDADLMVNMMMGILANPKSNVSDLVGGAFTIAMDYPGLDIAHTIIHGMLKQHTQSLLPDLSMARKIVLLGTALTEVFEEKPCNCLLTLANWVDSCDREK